MAFVGRGRELAILAGEFGRACEREPRVVLVEGEAGVGKSSLLSHFVSRLDGVRLMRASGDESELLLPYGVLAQLGGARVGCRGQRRD